MHGGRSEIQNAGYVKRFIAVTLLALALAACTSGAASTNATATADVKRNNFLGAFFRPEDRPPFGVFSIHSPQKAPMPYPEPTSNLFGARGYCDVKAANGVSISSGYRVDEAKLANIVDLGVRWTRTPVAQFFDDQSHLGTAQPYVFTDLDAAQCALARKHIDPMISLEAGPVQYNAIEGQYSPKSVPLYKTAQDFGTWCGVVAKHERDIFRAVHRYSEPGNEVNGNAQLFPQGDVQAAAYSKACYAAIKRIDPQAFIYGFELNMDRSAAPSAFVEHMYALGCRKGTCYDGISVHLSLRYPLPALGTPCYPNAGGDYSMRCIDDIQVAAHTNVHVIVGETGYFVPNSVPNEETKAKAVAGAFHALAANPTVDGVNYANVDECDLYPNGYFIGGCLVDSLGNKLPAYRTLQRLTARNAY
jgi:hypothetical protein